MSQPSPLEIAKRTFVLHNPEPATPRAWELYTQNRVAAAAADPYVPADDSDDDFAEESDTYIPDAIKASMKKLEVEMGLEENTLQQAAVVLKGNDEFDDEEPRTVTILSRLYSPTSPKYIDIHLTYHCRARMSSIEWFYSLGFNIHTRIPSTPTSPSAILASVRQHGSPEGVHAAHGWRNIAYGYYDDADADYGRDWKRIEVASFGMRPDDVLDAHEALWGPLDDLPPDASEDATITRRRGLVRTVRALIGAVGIEYGIACTDAEVDKPSSGLIDWTLEGLSNRWFARGARKACGFQLTRDPEEERMCHEERQEHAQGYDDDEFDSDEDRSEDDDDEHW